MQSLNRNGFTAEQLKAALHSPIRKMSFRYELLDSANRVLRELTTVTDASISMSSDASIQRTAKFIVEDSENINYLSERIKPYVRISISGGYAEFPLGVFLLSSPSKSFGTTIVRNIDAYDQVQILNDDKVIGLYRVAAGTSYVTAIRSLLTSAGIITASIASSTKTLPVDREWDGGTTKLAIVNELLSALGYNPIYFDEDGAAVGTPYISPDQRISEYTYADDEYSVIFQGSDQTEDLFSIPNQFVLVVSQPDRPVLKSVYTNTNPASPTSTVSRGRTIVDYQSVDAADQATLDSLAQMSAFKASQIYQTVTFSTAIMPHHSYNDVISFNSALMGVSSKYEEIGWSMQLKAGSRMQHTIRRVIIV